MFNIRPKVFDLLIPDMRKFLADKNAELSIDGFVSIIKYNNCIKEIDENIINLFVQEDNYNEIFKYLDNLLAEIKILNFFPICITTTKF